MLAGSIANAKLSNSSVTINSNSLALGASLTLDTDDIGEGSTNQYYTNARSRAALSVTGSTGLTYNDSTGVLAGLDATTSVKGVASFASANFTVTSGAVAITGVDGELTKSIRNNFFITNLIGMVHVNCNKSKKI